MTKIGNQFTTQGFVPSSWEETPDGFLRVHARILKEGIMPYSRAELSDIPVELDGVDPIMLFVGMDALASGETLRSLEGAQVVAPDHIWITPDNTEAVKGATAGSAGVTGPFQEVDLLITDKEIIEQVKARQLGEISGGYHADCIFGEGEWNGQFYHGKQIGIFYNHVAVIPPGTGRGGFEVRILNNSELRSKILECYQLSDKNKEKFIKLVKDRTEMTESGLKKSGYLDTLIFTNKKEENTMSVKVQLKNTGKFINTDEEGAAAIAEESNGSGKKLEELMAEVEGLNAQIAELTASAEEGKGELSVYKEKLDQLLADETLEGIAEGMVEESAEADEIIENTFPEEDKEKKEKIKNSLKGLHGTKLHNAVLSACGVTVENMSAEGLAGAFKAQHQITNSFKEKRTTVAGARLMNTMTPVQTKIANTKTRTSAERLGLKSN